MEQEKADLNQIIMQTKAELEATQNTVNQITLQLETEKNIVVNLKVELQQLQVDFAAEKEKNANLESDLTNVKKITKIARIDCFFLGKSE